MESQQRQHFDEIDSTNRWLREHAKDFDHGFYVDADFQTAGKGQATNKWESEKGKNLLFSLLLEPEKIPIKRQFLLSELVSLTIVDVIKKHLDCDVCIKWPNDIYVGDKKLCGILIETFLNNGIMQKAILGIGLNVNQTVFKSDAPNPISMKNVAQKDFDRKLILSDLIGKILKSYDNFSLEKSEELQQRYFAVLYRNSGFHQFSLPNGENFEAKIVKVEPTGHLILSDEKGDFRSFAFKEVQFVLPKN